jgi:hypothetical protein
LREEIGAGHPVVTLVKCRAVPGDGGAQVYFDHYIAVAALASKDFVYNHAAYSGESGYGVLIFQRVLVGGVKDESGGSQAVGETDQDVFVFGGFVRPGPEPPAIDASVGRPNPPAAAVARASAPLVSLPVIAGRLAWLAAGLQVAVLVLTGRRCRRRAWRILGVRIH